MDDLLNAIAVKKAALDAMRPVSRSALIGLQKAYDVDLTYTSNAIEGNRFPPTVIPCSSCTGVASAHCCPEPAGDRRYLQHVASPYRGFSRTFPECRQDS